MKRLMLCLALGSVLGFSLAACTQPSGTSGGGSPVYQAPYGPDASGGGASCGSGSCGGGGGSCG